jgi:predicted nucleic acid-binding Zn ribbon protein
MNIAITDIADLQPLAATLARLLKQDGWFALLDIKPPRAWITSFSL